MSIWVELLAQLGRNGAINYNLASPLSKKKKKKLHHSSHIRLTRRPINNKGWNSKMSMWVEFWPS
jgi:uncharacterized protein YifN (PemK superfamily)